MVKVAVLGAAGGIGQPLSLLLKSNTMISELSLYDIANTPGVAADLSHINTPAKVTSHIGEKDLPDALKGSHIVVIPAGVPRKPGMSRDDLFLINAGIIKNLAIACASHCPKAFICVISNPVNSTVPIVAEVFKQMDVYDSKRLFGVTTLDIVRSSTFVGQAKARCNLDIVVNVIGGHSGKTIIPLLSELPLSFTKDELDAIVHRIQFGGDEVVQAKNGTGSATLSMAYAGARFVNSLIRASVKKEKGVVECTYINTDVADGVSYFSTPVELGTDGVHSTRPLPTFSDYEAQLYAVAIPELKASIAKGVDFAVKGKL